MHDERLEQTDSKLRDEVSIPRHTDSGAGGVLRVRIKRGQVSVLRTNIEKVKLDMVRIFAGAPNPVQNGIPCDMVSRATWYPVRHGIPAATAGAPRAAQATGSVAADQIIGRCRTRWCLLIGALVSTLGIVLATLRFVKTGSPVPRSSAASGLLVVCLFVCLFGWDCPVVRYPRLSSARLS
jgi:hypothetical protein